MTDRANDIVTIFNAFKSNEDFFVEILKEALSIGKEDEARKIVRARDELKNGYDISNDTVELIKNNIDKYLNIINKLNEKNNSKENQDENTFTTSNDTYKINFDDEKTVNNDTYVLTDSDIEKKDDDLNKNEDGKNNNIGDSSNTVDMGNTPDISNDEVIDDINVVYSSNIAKKNLENELAQVNSQIEIIRSNINSSEKMPNKKLYQQLFQLESYRDKIQNKLDSINLEESYGDNARIANNDNKLSDINEKINTTKEKKDSNKHKFVKVVLSNKIKNLQKQKGKIQERQRAIVNSDLLKYYKSSFRNSKSDSKSSAIDQYYQDKKELLQEKKEAILDNVDEYSNNIFTNAKNKFYKYKSMPTELRIKHIENLQNQNGLKDKMGRVVGFNRVKKEIANKLYPKAQNSIRQHIDRLKELRGQLKMEEMYSNLAKEQPALESSIIRH